jgi:hypothetical protein
VVGGVAPFETTLIWSRTFLQRPLAPSQRPPAAAGGGCGVCSDPAAAAIPVGA